jgi:HTH-type transcriptional regulator / antitoxin HigA
MTANAISPRRYAKLLAEALPAVIETEAENERMLAIAESLIDKGEAKTVEELRLLKLIVRLIEDFEDTHYQMNAATPHTILLDIMESRGVKQSQLWEVFGSKSTASQVLSGKREISKAHARALARFFNVSVELFI